MRTLFYLFLFIFLLSSPLKAMPQTDTHTYIVSKNDHAVLAINRQTGEEKRIDLGSFPQCMVIYGEKGYVASSHSNKLYVIDLNSNTLAQIVPMGSWPQRMAIYGDKGYVVNGGSNDVSVVDLRSNRVIQTIPVGSEPAEMLIHEGMGYVVSTYYNDVSVIDLKMNTVTQTINLGNHPQSMMSHKNKGYVMNKYSNNVSVIDLTSNTVIQTIPVGNAPLSMVIYGGMGYVTNYESDSVSVLDLTSTTVIKTISVGNGPGTMVIHGVLGYVMNFRSKSISVIDLETNRVIKVFLNPDLRSVDFSDTHVYMGLDKFRPHYPSLSNMSLLKTKEILSEFVAMMPEVFQLGEIEQRKFPKERNEFDTLPPYVLAQEFFWDLKTDKPLMDPKDILATLVTMKYPQKFLKGDLGVWLRKRLHMAFFQTVWVGDKNKAKAMLKYFVQLQDPVITKLATCTFKDATNTSELPY